MLNWADLCCLLTVLMGPLAGFGAAYAQKAGWGVIISFTLGGLLLGVGVAFGFSKMSYSVLRSKKLPGVAQAILYLLTPLTGLLIVLFLPVFLADIIYK